MNTDLISRIYQESIELILQSEHPIIQEVQDYIARECNFEIVKFNYIGAVERKNKNEPLEVTLYQDYVNFISDIEEPFAKTERTFTALHELFENALYLKNEGQGRWCPKANALACLTLTGNPTPTEIREYIHEEWGYVSYFPNNKLPESRLMIEFLTEMQQKFNLTKENAYIYLRTNTLLNYGINYIVNNPKEYAMEVN